MEKLILEEIGEAEGLGLTIGELFNNLIPKLTEETRKKLSPTKLNHIVLTLSKTNKVIRFNTPTERYGGKFSSFLYTLPQYSRPLQQEEASYYRMLASAQHTFLNLFANKSTPISTISMQKYFDIISSLTKFKMETFPETEKYFIKEELHSFITLFKKRKQIEKKMEIELKRLTGEEEPQINDVEHPKDCEEELHQELTDEELMELLE